VTLVVNELSHRTGGCPDQMKKKNIVTRRKRFKME
jgi:hypothetical protein